MPLIVGTFELIQEAWNLILFSFLSMVHMAGEIQCQMAVCLKFIETPFIS